MKKSVINIWVYSCLLVLSPTSLANEPVADYLIAPDDQGTDNLTRINQQQTNPPSPRPYLEAIEDLESDFGAYDQQLTQHLNSLGQQYQSLGEHADAIEAFTRAMHIQRINAGLYDLGQVPILENLIESQVALGKWEDANDKHQYLFWLHKRNFGGDDPRMLPVINKLSNWHLNAYALDVSGGLFYHLVNAHNLYQIAVDIISRTYGDNDLRVINPLRGLTVSNYFLATYQIENRNKLAVTHGNSTANDEERMKLEQYILNSYNSGRKAINRMVNVYSNNPDAPPESHLRARVALGDWYLMFGKWHSAMEIYQQSYASLGQSEAGAKILKDVFDKPVALPDLPLIDIGSKTHINTENFVLAQFDVNAYGRVSKIEILDAFPEDNNRMKKRVKRTLKKAKFRPRFVDGEAVDTEGVTHRYLFSDTQS